MVNINLYIDPKKSKYLSSKKDTYDKDGEKITSKQDAIHNCIDRCIMADNKKESKPKEKKISKEQYDGDTSIGDLN